MAAHFVLVQLTVYLSTVLFVVFCIYTWYILFSSEPFFRKSAILNLLEGPENAKVN